MPPNETDAPPGIEEGANNAVELGVKQVQSVLQDIERKVAEFQRQQRATDAAAESLPPRRPVDVQLGPQVLEGVGPDTRSRLYYVLATRPDMGAALAVRGGWGVVVRSG